MLISIMECLIPAWWSWDSDIAIVVFVFKYECVYFGFDWGGQGEVTGAKICTVKRGEYFKSWLSSRCYVSLSSITPLGVTSWFHNATLQDSRVMSWLHEKSTIKLPTVNNLSNPLLRVFYMTLSLSVLNLPKQVSAESTIGYQHVHSQLLTTVSAAAPRVSCISWLHHSISCMNSAAEHLRSADIDSAPSEICHKALSELEWPVDVVQPPSGKGVPDLVGAISPEK